MAIFQYSILQCFTLYDGKQFSNVIVHTSRINDHDCKQYLNPLLSIEEFDWKRKYFTYRKNCKCIPMGQRLSIIIYFSHDDLVFYFLKTLIVWCQGLFLQYVVCVCVRISGRRNVDGHRTYGSLPDSAFFHSFVCQTSLFQLKIVYQAITWFENFYYYWMKLLPFQFWEYHLVSE